jgi:hypothetical protein
VARLARYGIALACLAVAGCGSGAQPRRPNHETNSSGLVARLPYLGDLTWRCGGRRFSTRLIMPPPGASLTVGVQADRHTLWPKRQVHPRPNGGRTVVGPFAATARQTWSLGYHHMPATLAATVRLRFTAEPERGVCTVTATRISVRRTPH